MIRRVISVPRHAVRTNRAISERFAELRHRSFFSIIRALWRRAMQEHDVVDAAGVRRLLVAQKGQRRPGDECAVDEPC